MKNSLFILLILCVISCIFWFPLKVAAQTVQPPYPSKLYSTRAEAWAACEADLPASLEYMKEGLPYFDELVNQYCIEWYYSNGFWMVTPMDLFFHPAQNEYQVDSYDGPSGMPVYAQYRRTYDCNSGSVPSGATCVPYEPLKNEGCGCDNSGKPVLVGNPINAATGNKFEHQLDASYGGIAIERYYNSDGQVRSGYMGASWLGGYDRSIMASGSTNAYTGNITATAVTVARPDGRELNFSKVNGVWSSDVDVADALTETDDANGGVSGWTLYVANARQYEDYSAHGRLIAIRDLNGTVATFGYTVGGELSSSGAALPADLLRTITDKTGRVTTLGYDDSLRVVSITIPDGGVISYSYNSNNYVSGVNYPDGTSRQYLYDEPAYSAAGDGSGKLTGIMDESGVRYATFGYQADGRAISTQHGQGAELYTINYASDGMSAAVTYPTGIQETLGFSNSLGTMKLNATSVPCGDICGQPAKSQTYDANGYPSSATDWNSNVTDTTYDTHGLLDQQIDASGTTDQRTTNITWNTTLRVPLSRTVLDHAGSTVSTTQWAYNAAGQTLARCQIDPTNNAATGYTCAATGAVPAGVRRWTYTYCTAVDGTQCPIVGLLLTLTGPRTDLTQTTHYSYYMDSATAGCTTPGGACHQPGDLYQVTDPLGHVTTYVSYDADGRVTRITDANGVNTDFTYSPRGWLTSRSVAGATTTFGYTPYGAVHTVTDPDGVITTFGYDAAHRLTDITDAQGNTVHYTLDAAGNKTQEQIFDSTGTARYSQSKTFNALGQLTTIVDGLNHTVFNASVAGDYDANGNLLHSSDALGVQTQRSYDALNRLVGTIRDYNGTDASTKNSTTTVAYDALDRVTGVSDPNSLVTSYTYDGLGDLTHLQSPDTGLSGGSAGDMFDAAGNLTQHTDARGVVTQYTYDALNRLTGKNYPAHPALNVTYTYDQAAPIAGCPNNDNIGHLTTMTDASGSTAWCYVPQGDIREVRQVINGVAYLHGYAYTPARRLKWLQYPSGFELLYGYDSDGRVATVGYLQNAGPYGSYTNSTVTPLITAVSYLPFGPMSGYSWAQGGQYVQRTYDQDYALTDITGSALNLHFLRDAKSRISAEGDTAGASPAKESYQSDALDRLTQLTDANGATEQAFSYNLTGDRLSKTLAGQSTLNYGYQSGTHQLTLVGSASRSVDADGNTTAMLTPNGTQVQLVYDDRNLLTQVQSGGSAIANYQYNGQGIRVWRTITVPSAGQATTVYDPLGTGNLYGEYFAADYREYVYLNGIPVASAADAGRQAPGIMYLHADGLGSVRAATNLTGAVTALWPWQNNAFGDQAMTGASTYYLRFPGQYYDVETGLHYNGHRYYDPSAGRYVQSDPIGLGGGINTYAYVDSDPLMLSDRRGLDDPCLYTYSACGLGPSASAVPWDPCQGSPARTEAFDPHRFRNSGAQAGTILGFGAGTAIGMTLIAAEDDNPALLAIQGAEEVPNLLELITPPAERLVDAAFTTGAGGAAAGALAGGGLGAGADRIAAGLEPAITYGTPGAISPPNGASNGAVSPPLVYIAKNGRLTTSPGVGMVPP